METSTDTDRSELFGAARVPDHSPLARFLRERVYGGALGLPGPGLRFLEPFDDAAVTRCDEVTTPTPYCSRCTALIWIDRRRWDRPAPRVQLRRREYENLRRARGLVLSGPPHRVVLPLAISEDLGRTSAEVYVPGPGARWPRRTADPERRFPHWPARGAGRRPSRERPPRCRLPGEHRGPARRAGRPQRQPGGPAMPDGTGLGEVRAAEPAGRGTRPRRRHAPTVLPDVRRPVAVLEAIRHRHPAARQPQHDHVPAAQELQTPGRLPPG